MSKRLTPPRMATPVLAEDLGIRSSRRRDDLAWLKQPPPASPTKSTDTEPERS